MEAAFRVSSRRAAVDIGAAARLSPLGEEPVGRLHDSAGGSHRTCGNVYVEQGVSRFNGGFARNV